MFHLFRHLFIILNFYYYALVASLGDLDEEEETERRYSGTQTANAPATLNGGDINPSPSGQSTRNRQPVAPDLSLNCWLQSLGPASFSHPFQSQELQLTVNPINRPKLEPALWPEHILAEPTVRPLVFPYTHLPAAPSGLLSSSIQRSGIGARLMRGRLQGPGGELVRSLIPAYEGLSCGLLRGQTIGRPGDSATNGGEGGGPLPTTGTAGLIPRISGMPQFSRRMVCVCACLYFHLYMTAKRQQISVVGLICRLCDSN